TGSKAVGQCVSAERGSLVTMCGIVSAIGAFPPLFIFPRIRMKDQFQSGAVPGAVGFAEKSGTLKSIHIVSSSNRILLLLDNHETHVSLNAILYAREHGIVLLSFPPHCTHKIQPLDKAVYFHPRLFCNIDAFVKLNLHYAFSV
ncbi:hypothetical protein PPYR_15056, partial [Photinus pyralis]